MRSFAVSAFVVLSAAGLVAARAGPDVHIARSVRSLARRADASAPGSSQYLSEIFAMETAQCNSTCAVSLGDFDSCSKLSDQATIAACACSALTLGDLRSCASCISTTTKSTSNETSVVSSFVNLCLQEGLATVTGTVEVGVSTKPISRSSTSAASSASSASRSASSVNASSTVTSAPLATYNPSASYTATATVPSLVASGSIASSARAAAASASPSAQKTSGARSDGSVRMAVVAFAAVFGAAALFA
ncbi:hypothetical protein BMF94_4105 [Rhodotorula taiwanensis]|uniref:Extracellular membrane protein CFEM domain-containing protein n=1 Tax=Rhodotorula taiwanensis TaxID=741276 RepID=A0A2S5B7V0_9BASI|nr:hypothetical protein BMF94_4105 [Rhodotorula taiwanensis]